MPAGTRTLLIKGKPGQGKTVLAASLYSSCTAQKIWFMLDENDRDAAAFRSRFERACVDCLGTLRGAAPDDVTATGFSDDFLDSLSSLDAVHIFIDNIDLIVDAAAVMNCLNQLLRGVTDDVRFTLASRTRVPTIGMELASHNGYLIDDLALAFTPTESIACFEKYGAFDASDISLIHDVSRGWPLCVVQGAERLRSGIRRSSDIEKLAEDSLSHCLELLTHAAGEEHTRELARLALDRNFDIATIPDHDRRRTALDYCGDLVSLDQDHLTRFVAPLKKFLRTRLHQLIAPSDITKILASNIQDALMKDRLIDAIDGLTQMSDIAALEALARERGAALEHVHWHDAMALIDGMGGLANDNCPYLKLYFGRWSSDRTPLASQKLMEQATEILVAKEDELGELWSLILRTELQFSLGRVKPVALFFPRLLELYERLGDSLNDMERATLLVQFASLAVYVSRDSERAQGLLYEAQALLADRITPEAEAEIEYLRGMDHLFHGRRTASFDAVERIANTKPLNHESMNIQLAFLRANFLAAIAQYNHLQYLVEDELEKLDPRVLEQRMTGGYFQLRRCHFLLMRGDYQAVHDLMNELQYVTVFATDGDAREQGLRVLALAHSYLGNFDQAASVLQRVGEPSSTLAYRVANETAVALTYLNMGEYERSTEILSDLMAHEKEDPDLAAATAGVLAYSLGMQEHHEEAIPYIERWINLAVRQDGQDILGFGNTRDGLHYIIKAAGTQFPERVDFARFTASLVDRLRYAFDDDYNAIPLLNITTAPVHEISLDEQPVKLTKMQRRILMVIALSPDKKISRQSLLTELWPDESNADSRLYMQVSRLRKAFTDQGADLSSYLVVNPGELALRNTYLDVSHFEAEMKVAEGHERNGYTWLSQLVRLAALDLWPGFFDPSLEVLLETEDSKRHAILGYQRILVKLVDAPGLTQASERRLVSHLMAYFALEPENPGVAMSLARLYRRLGDAAGLSVAREKFRAGLARLELPAEEVLSQMRQFDLSGHQTSI